VIRGNGPSVLKLRIRIDIPLVLLVAFLISCTPYRSYTFDQHTKRATTATNRGFCDSALIETTKALEIARAQQGSKEPGKELVWRYDDEDDNRQLAYALHNSGYVHRKCGKYSEAASLYSQAAVLNEDVYGPNHRVLANDLIDLGVTYIDMEQYEQAEPPLKRALEIYARPENRALEHSAKPALNLARAYRSQGKLAEAETMFDRGVKAAEELYWSGAILGSPWACSGQSPLAGCQAVPRSNKVTKRISASRVGPLP
jgi:tetratricopeptide (TPR) repeat protein